MNRAARTLAIAIGLLIAAGSVIPEAVAEELRRGIVLAQVEGAEQQQRPNARRSKEANPSVVTSGPRLGDVEAGAVASATGPRFSVTSGGLACMAGVGLIMLAFPALMRYDAEEHLPPQTG